MSPQKPIFLDIDGPMVPARTFVLNGHARFGWKFDPVAVSFLNFLSWVDPTVCIVLSTHRWGDGIARPCHGVRNPFPNNSPSMQSKKFWDTIFKQNGMKVRFHEDWLTPRVVEDDIYFKRPKHQEIADWLRLHPETDHFVTVEDDLMGGFPPSMKMRRQFNLVGEDYDLGLTWSDFKKMQMFLGLRLTSDKYAEYNQLQVV